MFRIATARLNDAKVKPGPYRVSCSIRRWAKWSKAASVNSRRLAAPSRCSLRRRVNLASGARSLSVNDVSYRTHSSIDGHWPMWRRPAAVIRALMKYRRRGEAEAEGCGEGGPPSTSPICTAKPSGSGPAAARKTTDPVRRLRHFGRIETQFAGGHGLIIGRLWGSGAIQPFATPADTPSGKCSKVQCGGQSEE